MQLDLEAKEQFQQKFIIISLLGKGSFGFVYQCIDKQDNQVYAVKVISKNNVKKSKIECLRQEAKILSNIQHSNIVKVYEFVQLITCIFLKMEIIRNGTLDQLIKKRWQSGQKFTDIQIATIMSSLFKSVNHIHSVSIIHRDIKPQNILLPNQKQLDKIKMADFGLSTKLDFHYPKTATMKCGTMLFMAPQILCNYTYTKSVDIWSLSIIMYMLFNGKHPFYQQKMTTDQYKRKIKNIKFPPLNQTKQNVELVKLAQDFLNKISKVQANERYSAQQALRHPWLTRNMDDQIPLSLHESFASFQKSHQISYLIKILIASKSLGICQKKTQIPEDYMKKLLIYSDQSIKRQPQTKNSRSRKHLNTLNNLNITFQKQHKQKQKQNINKRSVQIQNDNPAIQKLNTIFNNLFGKRNKLQVKTYTEGVTTIFQPRQNLIEAPDISNYKQKIQNEIQRAVKQFKGSLKPNSRRIMPYKQQNIRDGYTMLIDKEQLKIQNQKFSSSLSKNKYRRRVCPLQKKLH